MEINQLLYFLEVARQKSFTGAAKSLHVSQPAISKMIRLLEEELGVVLFNRTPHYVELTDYGIAIQSQVQKMVQSFQDIRVELDDVTSLHKGSIRIGIPPMVGEMFFPKIVGLFHQQYPNIKMKLLEVGARAVEDGVEDGSLDVGVVVLPIKAESFELHEFAKSPLQLIVDPRHELAGRDVVRFADLKGQPFVLYREDFGLHKLIYDACSSAGFEPDVVCETSQWDFMAKVVASQLGIALLPQRVCQELSASSVRVIPLEGPVIYWHLALIWRKNAYLSQASRIWINFAKSQFPAMVLNADFWNRAVPS